MTKVIKEDLLSIFPSDVDIFITGIRAFEFIEDTKDLFNPNCEDMPVVTVAVNLGIKDFRKFIESSESIISYEEKDLNYFEVNCPNILFYCYPLNRGKIEEDWKQKDFRYDSVYYNLKTGEHYDPSGYGIEDFKNRVIIPISTLGIKNPVNILNVVVLCSNVHFNLTNEFKNLVKKDKSLIKLINRNVLRNKLLDIIESDKPNLGIELLHELKILEYIIPEFEKAWGFDQMCKKYHDFSLTEHSLRVLENLKDEIGEPELKMAALLHDLGKCEYYVWRNGSRHYKDHNLYSANLAEKILHRLGFDEEFISGVSFLIKNHMILKQIYKFKGNIRDYPDLNDILVAILDHCREYTYPLFSLIEADNNSKKETSYDKNISYLRERLSNIYSSTAICRPGPVLKEEGKLDTLESIIIGYRILKQFDNHAYPGILHYKEEFIKNYKDKTIYAVRSFDGNVKFSLGKFKLDPTHGFWYTSDVVLTLRCDSRFKDIKKGEVTELKAILYPTVYDKLERELIIKDILTKISPELNRLENLDSFSELDLSLSDHDLCVDISWTDGSKSQIL